MSSGYQIGKKNSVAFSFIFFLWLVFVPSRSCLCPLLPSLFLGWWLCENLVLGSRIACDELNWQKSLFTTDDVHDLNHWVLVSVLDCSIKLSPKEVEDFWNEVWCSVLEAQSSQHKEGVGEAEQAQWRVRELEFLGGVAEGSGLL